MGQGGHNKGKGRNAKWLRDHANHAGLNCLKYPFSVNKQTGYGQFGLNGELLYAHRFMCELKNGPAPSEEHHAAHTCGNGHMACVNPMHLVWKTVAENSADRTRHGNQKASLTPHSILDHAKAAEIRALKGIKTQVELAGIYGVSRETISSIQCGRGWNGTRDARRFTPEEVQAIRAAKGATTMRELGEQYGVKLNVIERIMNGKSYQHYLSQQQGKT